MTKKTVPVSKNENYIVTVEGMGHEGQGVARIEGFTIFVEGALLGEEVEIKIVKISKNFGFGKLINIITPSPNRTEERCKIYKKCGGCHLQHMDYQGQLEFKTRQVKGNIERIAKLDSSIVRDVIGMEQPWRYRNKAQFPVGADESGLILGFYAKRSHNIIDTNTCYIQHDVNDRIIEVIKEFGNRENIEVYNEISHRGLLRHVVIKVGFTTKELMVILVTNGSKLPKSQELVEELRSRIPEITTIVQNINSEKTNVIMGRENKILYGPGYIHDYIGDLKFAISPHSFFQVNPVQTKILYGKALEYAALTGKETVIDAYCGIGTISLFLAAKAKKVIGVEIVAAAIEDAKNNAKLNNIDNAEFYAGEAEVIIPDLYKKGTTADVVMVDPPRKGCDEKLLDTIVSMAPERVVYVSCDPSTLARDLRYLEDRGFKTVEVQPVDMFPHTNHVEVVTLLVKE